MPKETLNARVKTCRDLCEFTAKWLMQVNLTTSPIHQKALAEARQIDQHKWSDLVFQIARLTNEVREFAEREGFEFVTFGGDDPIRRALDGTLYGETTA